MKCRLSIHGRYTTSWRLSLGLRMPSCKCWGKHTLVVQKELDLVWSVSRICAVAWEPSNTLETSRGLSVLSRVFSSR